MSEAILESPETTEAVAVPVFPGFDAGAFDALVASDDGVIADKRRSAFAAYLATPLPHDRDEEYRRTPPRLLKLGAFASLPRIAVTHGDVEAVGDFDGHVILNDGGCVIGPMPEGVTVCALEDADPALLAEVMQDATEGITEGKPRKLRQLNHAFWNVGLFVHVARNVRLEKGLLIRTTNRVEGTAMLPRLVVVGEEGSEATISEWFTSDGEAATQCICSREVVARANSNIRVISMQDCNRQAIHLSEDWGVAHRDATLYMITLTLGGKVSKNATGCDVCEANANAYLGGLYFAEQKQHFDQLTLQRHSSPNTYSNMLYRGASKTKGYSVYQGIIRATEGSIGVDAYQTNNNLILDNTARADSLPGLIINADDLACSHGATMGNLDEEQVYYLRSRGISDVEARKMLVLGFFDEVIEERIPSQIMRDRLHDVIEAKLGA